MPAIFIIAILFITFVGISSLFIPDKNKNDKKEGNFSMGSSKMINGTEKDDEHDIDDKKAGKASKAMPKERLKPQNNYGDKAGNQADLNSAAASSEIADGMAADKQTLIEGKKSIENSEGTEQAEAVEEIILEKTKDSDNPEKAKYVLRLKNIEAYYAAVWKDACPPDMAGMKELENEEYAKWDEELNLIYQKIKEEFSEEDFLEVREAEREWIKERDEKAAKAASEFSGGSMENLEYMAVMTEMTRLRTYELVDLYFE